MAEFRGIDLMAATVAAALSGMSPPPPRGGYSTGSPKPLAAKDAAKPKSSKRRARRQRAKEGS